MKHLSAYFVFLLATSLMSVSGAYASGACEITPPGPGFVLGNYRIFATAHVYLPSDNLQSAIQTTYGAKARLAKWELIKSHLRTPSDARNFSALVGLPQQDQNFECGNFFVSHQSGEWYQGHRLLIARHDGKRTSDWLALDEAGVGYIHLGRWNHPSQALVLVPSETPGERSPDRAASNMAPAVSTDQAPSTNRIGSFPFSPLLLTGSISTLQGVGTETPSMTGGFTEEDIRIKCSKDPKPWNTVNYCVRAMQVLVGKSEEKGLDLLLTDENNLRQTDQGTSAYRDRGLKFESAQARCSLRKLSIQRRKQAAEDFVAQISIENPVFHWYFAGTNDRVYDFHGPGPINRPSVDYLTELFSLLCPNEVRLAVRNQILAAFEKSKRSEYPKFRCVGSGRVEQRFESRAYYLKKLNFLRLGDFDYPQSDTVYIEGKSRTQFGLSDSFFRSISDSEEYEHHCQSAIKSGVQAIGGPSSKIPSVIAGAGSTRRRAFEGKWADKSSLCRFENGDPVGQNESVDGNVVIKGGRLTTYESECRIRNVEKVGPEFRLRMDCESEGERTQPITKIVVPNPNVAFIDGLRKVRCD